jgi:tRNA wybutosine-synthesizing protein 2
MNETPLDLIKKSLSNYLPKESINILPEKWEKIGNVLIIKLDKRLSSFKEIVSKKYCEILQCKTVLQDVGGISGTFRKPNVKLLYGSENTETIHVENKIKYKLDPRKIMFSSGNMDERIRISKIPNKNEIIVDMFAGIGYFTLPIAVYSKPKKIFSCEINPDAYKYLCDNIVLNNVTSIVQPLLGDNKKIAPVNVADRVVMGYITDTYRYLPTAINCLKNKNGIIHYHDVFPNELIPEKPIEIIKKIATKCEVKFDILNYRSIKSYAPGINHFVFDLEFGE